MNENARLPIVNNVVIAVLAVLAVLLLVAVLTNTSLPILSDMRAIFVALTAVGFGMCLVGPLTHLRTAKEWRRVENVIGAVLGVLALLLVIVELFSIRFPLIPDARTAVIWMGVLIAAKLLIAMIPWRTNTD